jgi:hypothetical protein
VVVAEVVRAPDTDALWRLTMEHSPIGMAILSPAGNFLSANVALCDMLGYDPDVMTTLTCQDITHPDDLAADLRLAARAVAGEISSYRITKRYIRSDGSTLVGDLSVALLRDAHGAPIHFISQIADLTERQAFVDRLDAAEAAAEDERRKAQAVFEGVNVGLLHIDADGHYIAHNTRLREFLDLAFPEGHRGVAGQPGFAYDADQRRLEPDEMPSARAARGEQFNDVRVWVGEDPASRRALSVSARSVLDDTGALAGAVLAYHDVSDLLRAMSVKDEFVSAVSHELRTPLTSALAYLELLDESADVSAECHQQVTAARRNMLRLSHLVADLIFTTRASAGSPLLDPYRVDVATLLAEAVDAACLDAESAHVRLESRRPETLVAVADGMRLRQVFDNLLDNAIGYSRPGGAVTVDLAEVDGALELVVADEGVGIEACDLDEVFGRFYRGANARLLNVPGTGLGLTIVRTIVEAHGGHVTLDSAPGRGTTVRVAIPR